MLLYGILKIGIPWPVTVRSTKLIPLVSNRSSVSFIFEKLHIANANGFVYFLEAVMAALARTLREDAKRSMELATTIAAILLQLAQVSEFRPVLTTNKVGDTCLKILDHEIRRAIVLSGADPTESNTDLDLGDQEVNSVMTKKRARLVLARQDILVQAVVGVLTNLASDISVQAKMARRGIAAQLLSFLMVRNDPSPPLLHSLIRFLVVLSQYRENVLTMRGNDDTPPTWLTQLLPQLETPGGGALGSDIIRFLLNLSHDPVWRSIMIRAGCLSAAITQFRSTVARGSLPKEEVLLLLYQFSCEERTRAMFAYTDVLPLV
jgi:hypothetical protein